MQYDSLCVLNYVKLTEHSSQLTKANTINITFIVPTCYLNLSEIVSDISSSEFKNLAKFVRSPRSHVLYWTCNSIASVN